MKKPNGVKTESMNRVFEIVLICYVNVPSTDVSHFGTRLARF